jgi:hypothetical protein
MAEVRAGREDDDQAPGVVGGDGINRRLHGGKIRAERPHGPKHFTRDRAQAAASQEENSQGPWLLA